MTTQELLTITLAVIGILWGAIQQYKNGKLMAERDSKHAMWRKLDSLSDQITTLNNTLKSDYMTTSQIHEFFRLSTEPWIVKLDHIDNQLSELKQLLERRLSDT